MIGIPQNGLAFVVQWTLDIATRSLRQSKTEDVSRSKTIRTLARRHATYHVIDDVQYNAEYFIGLYFVFERTLIGRSYFIAKLSLPCILVMTDRNCIELQSDLILI